MARFRPISQFEYAAATAIIAGTLAMASSFPYLFIGPLPIWIVLGTAGVILAAAYSRLVPALAQASELRWVLGSWLLLIVMSGALDVIGYMPRDVMGGAVLNFATFIVFIGLFALATYANIRFIIKIIIAIAGFQGLLGIAQFFGSDTAWRFPDLVADLFPMSVRIEYDDLFDVSQMSFQDIGRVRGSLPHVHLYNHVQSLLAALSIMVALNYDGVSNRLPLLGRLAVLIAIFGTFLTFSRSGVLTILGTVVIALTLKPKPSRILVASIGGLLVLVILAYSGFFEADQFNRLRGNLGEGASNLGRFDQYELAWSNFVNNPLIGASGPNGFANLELPIHSVPMRYLNDYGLIGLSLYACVFFGLVALFVRRLRSPIPSVSAWASCGVSVLTVIVVDSWTHSSGFLRRDLLQTAMLGFVLGAMLDAEWRAALREAEPRLRQRIGLRTVG